MTTFLNTPDDLSNLKLIDPKLVDDFLQKLNVYKGDKKLIMTPANAMRAGATILLLVAQSRKQTTLTKPH